MISRKQWQENARRGGIAVQKSPNVYKFSTEDKSKGGKKAHEIGAAYQFSEEDVLIGAEKGGNAVIKKYGREHFVMLGKLSAQKKKEARTN
jgi:hypothetical protein